MNDVEKELARFLHRCAFPERAYAEGFEPAPIYRAQAASIANDREIATHLLLILRKLFGGASNA